MTRRDAPCGIWLTGALLAVLAMLASNPAAAELWPPVGFRPLTADDLARMHAAAARLYQGQSIGRVERWRSPTSKDAGEIMLARIFTAKGMPCRTIIYTTRLQADRSTLSHYKYNWCMVSPNTWKLVELNDAD